MFVEFSLPRSGRGPLAEVVLKFTDDEGPLLGDLELHGMTVWAKNDGGKFIKLPGREYQTRDGQKKAFDFLRFGNTDKGRAKMDRLKGLILAEYETWALNS